MKMIMNEQLKRLNKKAIRNIKNALTDDCPVLVGGYHVPVVWVIPSIDTVGWYRCQIPATSDCETHVFLDVWYEDFEKLSDIPSTLAS
jgi:hypothetical protein